jgi:hypothetical protein
MCARSTQRPRKHTRRSPTELNTISDLVRIVVAADPHAALAPTREAQMIKAALLYGNRVTVLSPFMAMLLRASELGGVSPKRQIEVLQQVAPLVTAPAQIAQLRSGLALMATSLGKAPKARSSTDLVMRQTLLKDLRSAVGLLTTVADHALQVAGISDLAPAKALGLLDFRSGASGDDFELLAACLGQALLAIERGRLDESHDARLFDAFAAGLSRQLSAGRDWLLFDRSTAPLAFPGRNGRWISWGRLPTFPEAAVDELLAIRSQLSAPIERLHRALGFVSASFAGRHALPTSDEIDDAWHKTVRPAVDGIVTEVRDDPALREASVGIPGALTESWPGLALVAAVAADREPLASGGESQEPTSALSAASHRRLSRHEVSVPSFTLLFGAEGAVPDIKCEADLVVHGR